MILVRQSFIFELEDVDGARMLRKIELAGRTCYKSEERVTKDSSAKFVADIIKRGHESVLEHEKVTVRVICDRGVSHEIVRHRLASYSQESTRYCNYGKKEHLTFVIPSWCNLEAGEVNQRDLYNNPAKITTDAATLHWLNAMFLAEQGYLGLLKDGWRPEQARSVLPNSLKTEIVMTMNLREWRHFFRLRTAEAAHPDMRDLARPMLVSFKQFIPIVFDDIPSDFIKL